VFLNPETAWGHHGFCDSPTNGPVGRALVEEFVPFLEERFRLIATPEARVVTGHSSGGWTSLHLALTYPATFGACFASAPDPVDFSAFQRSDLYRDASLFLAADGSDTPSFRQPLGPTDERVAMTVRDEITTERVLDPNGRSGQQWAAWDAMWSPFEPQRGAPRRICDPETGAIDPVTAEAWSRHDLAKRFEREPARVAGLFATRIRLVCGTRDSFYLNEAVARLKSKIEAWREAARARGETPETGPGYIELLDGLTHETCHSAAQLRFHQGIRDHFLAHGLAELPPRPAAETSSKTK
jgi:S-formylglutathione hydrolase FrmB